MSSTRLTAGDSSEMILPEASRRAQGYRPHLLHGSQMVRKQSNCYVDLWIELLTQWGLDPHAALPFTLTQDFEVDQFTFFKFPLEDLELLYGVVVQEHAIFEPLPLQIERQVKCGHVMLVEVDAWHLPDTRGITYQQQHTKTTIGIDAIDRAHRRLGYFHNSGYYLASDADFDGLLELATLATLPSYVECAKRRFKPLQGVALREASLALFLRHLQRRPSTNPIVAFRQALARDAAIIASQPMSYFHAYSFNTFRQLGANFELLGHYLNWLNLDRRSDPGLIANMVTACNTIATESMVLEFRLARACSRGKEDRGESSLDVLEHAYSVLTDRLDEAFPVARIEPYADVVCQQSQYNLALDA